MTTIYLSSTYLDLKEHRTAVFEALRRSGYHVIAMEDYVARDERPVKACLDDVDRADIYVGLFAFRYGYIPPAEHGNPDRLSITELEFRRADSSPKTRCLVFLLDETAPWATHLTDTWTGEADKGERIRQLRNELSREKMGSFFSGTYELASLVQAAVTQCLAPKTSAPNQPPEQPALITWDVAEKGSPYPGLLPLVDWVAEHQEELRLLHVAEVDAVEWQRQGHAVPYLWPTDRLRRLQAVIEGLPTNRASEALRAFAWSQQQLIRLLHDLDLAHETRDSIGRQLAALGDPRPGLGVRDDGTPDIDWVAIRGGEVKLEKGAGKVGVEPFHLARYLITNAQFQAFVDAEDGYRETAWWKAMPPDANKGLKEPRWPESNRPRETVSWYEAVAFCRWLSRRLGFEVRLPTDYEWQQAATGGDPARVYPWGGEWDERRCNTHESGLKRTTAVGLYPLGASAQGVLDLAGNLWEWCLSKYLKPPDAGVDESNESRVVRGGSWCYGRDYARADSRDDPHPVDRLDFSGFRVLCASPIR